MSEVIKEAMRKVIEWIAGSAESDYTLPIVVTIPYDVACTPEGVRVKASAVLLGAAVAVVEAGSAQVYMRPTLLLNMIMLSTGRRVKLKELTKEGLVKYTGISFGKEKVGVVRIDVDDAELVKKLRKGISWEQFRVPANSP